LNEKNSSLKSGFEKIIAFFNENLELNHPIAIAEVVERTGFSWSFVKKTLTKIKEEYDGFYFEKSGSTWIMWKDRDHVIKKLDETCSRFLDESEK
jgi:dissimilatory sulfite reductase (desulfoviridin) alpha/beta subunit